MKQKNPSIKIYNHLTVQILEKESIVKIGKTLNSRAHKFIVKFDELRLPLRYSIMALISNNRVSIFNETLVPFVNQLAIDKKWNSDKYSDYGSYIIDQMSYELNPRSKVPQDLTEFFRKQLEVAENREHYDMLLKSADRSALLR